MSEYDTTFRQLMVAYPQHSWAKIYTQMWNLAMKEPIISPILAMQTNKIGETDLHLNLKKKAETGTAGNSIKTSVKVETVTMSTDVNIAMLGVTVFITAIKDWQLSLIQTTTTTQTAAMWRKTRKLVQAIPSDSK